MRVVYDKNRAAKMNQIDLRDKRAIVTGGAQGIGYAVAARMIASGASVAILDIDADRGAAAAAELGAVAVPCDAASWESCQAAVEAAEGRIGPLDIAILGAGITGPNQPTHAYPVEEWRKVIDLDLNGIFFGLRAVLPGMRTRGYGRIVTIASVAGKDGNPNAPAYSAAKAGVIALTKSAAKENADLDIAINCVTPAAAKTAIFEQMSEEHIAYMLSKIPRGRFVTVDEIAAMIAWMVSAENSFTTGAAFDLSGGRSTY